MFIRYRFKILEMRSLLILGVFGSFLLSHSLHAQFAWKTEPMDAAGLVGSRVVLAGQAIGAKGIKYQWSKDGVNLKGATRATLQLPRLQSNQAGLYRLTASAAGSTLTSRAAALRVLNHLHVRAGAAGKRNGLTWADAFPDLQSGLDAAKPGMALWVAQGKYVPSKLFLPTLSRDPRTRTFQFKGGVTIYGGFAGTETDLSQRNVEAYATILSGDLNRNDTEAWPPDSSRDDNVYRIGCALAEKAPIVLDGLIFEGGNSSTPNPVRLKRPLYGLPRNTPIFNLGTAFFGFNCDVQFRSCEFRKNGTPGNQSPSSAIVYGAKAHTLRATDCIFEENIGDRSGGALDISGWGKDNSAREHVAIFQRCLFFANEAHTRRETNGEVKASFGGAFYAYRASVSSESCVFWNNHAKGNGMLDFKNYPCGTGGAVHGGDKLRFVNCLFIGNQADRAGGAIDVGDGTYLEVSFCTFYKNNCSADTGWGAGAISGWYDNVPNSLFGIGNIVRENTGSAGEVRWVADSGATPPATRLNQTLLTAGSLANNTGTILSGAPQFQDPSNPPGADGIFFTADDGFRLLPGDTAARGKVTAVRPTDAGDLDSDGDTTEPLPVDLRGVPFGSSPWQAGAYQ